MLFEEDERRSRRSVMDRVNSNDDGLSRRSLSSRGSMPSHASSDSRRSLSSRGSMPSHASSESKSSNEDPATLKKVKKSKKDPPNSESSNAMKGPIKKGLTDQKKGHIGYKEGLTREKERHLGDQRRSYHGTPVDRSGGLSVAESESKNLNSTGRTERTSTTMESYERSCHESFDEAVGGLSPVRVVSKHGTAAHATYSGGVVPGPKDRRAMAAFHGERLQSFLTRHGRDEKLAMEQAMMFEAFLKSKVDLSPVGGDKNLSSFEPYQHDAAELNAIAQLKALELEDDEESRMEQAESLFGDDIADGNSFATGTAWWDNTSIHSYSDIAAIETVNVDNSFGKMLRNETFIQRKSAADHMLLEQKPRQAKNMIANAQARAMVSPMVVPTNPMVGPPPSTLHPPPPRQVKSAELTYRKVMTESYEMNRSDGRHTSQSQPMPAIGLHDGDVMGYISTRRRRGSSLPRLEGTVRSAPDTPTSTTTCSFEDQLSRLTVAQRLCVINLKTTWENGDGNKSRRFPDLWYIKFSKCSPGTPYDYKSALKVMQKFDRRTLTLSVVTIESQLNARTIFPCPGLLSAKGHAVMYFRMSNFSPKKDPVRLMLDSLVYVMNSMMECDDVCTDGLSLVSNMTDLKMTNVSVAYFHKIIMALQGRQLPTRVNLWLLVNPPAWFGSVWQIMRPMMSEEFRSKVFRISEKDMGPFMNEGYENFLPDDMKSGRANTDTIIRNYITERRRLEADKSLHYSSM